MHRTHSALLAAVLLVAIGAAMGCGKTPAAPTTSASGGIDARTQAAVNATFGQALSQAAMFGSTLTPAPSSTPVITFACPDGGNITTTFSRPVLPTGSGPFTSFTTNSRTDFNDCRSQDVVMRGDPALIQSGEFTFPAPTSGAAASVTSTSKTTGAILTISSDGTSRVRFDCQSVIVLELGSTSRPVLTATGTMTWENPVGTVVRTTACGPATQ